jgi:hypothetical protein
VHYRALGQVWRNEFGEALQVVLVPATNVKNCRSIRVEVGGFFDDRIEANFGEKPHAENVSLTRIIESLLSFFLPSSAGILEDMSNPHFTFRKALAFCVAHTCFGITFSHE